MEQFFNPTKICFGKNALDFLETFPSQRIFLIADPFLTKSGMIQEITNHLKLGQYEVYDQIIPDPPVDLVIDGIKAISEYHPDVVVAVGGGSAIDAAKAILYFKNQMDNTHRCLFIAIPTTSGTGSEVTSFSVITDQQKGVKYPLVDSAMRPDVAILDSILVKSVPATIVADTGMDVLTHSLEAYVSTKSNAFSDALAEKSIALVFEYLQRSYENPEDEEAKTMMHAASCMAGLAFDSVSLGLNHAIAHNIGGKFHVPHGRTNSILLPYVLEFNAHLTDYHQKDFSLAAEKYARISNLSGFGNTNIRCSVKALIHQIQKLQKQLHMPVSFRECNITATEYENQKKSLVQGALKDACILTNPRTVTEEDVEKILKKAF